MTGSSATCAALRRLMTLAFLVSTHAFTPALSFRLPALHSCAGRALAALPVDCGAAGRLRSSRAALRMSELKVDTYQPSVTPRKAVPSLEDRIAQLHELYEQTGQAMPSEKADPSLARWASRQRMLRRQGTLADAVIDELDAVHFVWDPLQAAWDARLEELERHLEQHGHCNVPSSGGAGPLGDWVARQRRLHRQGELRPERVEALVALGFEFDPAAARWERSFAAYAAASQRQDAGGGGSGAAVPTALVRWASRQRAQHAQGRLAPERVEALNQLEGWAWAPRQLARGPATLRRLGRRLSRVLPEVGEGVAAERSGGGNGGGGGSGSGASGGEEEEEEAEEEGAGVEAAPGSEGDRLGAGTGGAWAAANQWASLTGVSYARCESAGRALVVSVGARRQSGAAAELEDAREALRSLGYTVVTVQNPSASELAAALKVHASQPEWGRHASSVVALMGHGHSAHLECQDGRTVSLRGLFGLLAPAAAPALRGKPKVWLVQACRSGERPVLSVEAARGGGGSSSSSSSGGGGGSASATGAEGQDDAGSSSRGDDEEEEDGESHVERELLYSCGDSGDVGDGLGDGGIGGDDDTASGIAAFASLDAAVAAAPPRLSEEHDFLWAYATTPGTPAYRGALFAALREVAAERGCGCSWLELLQHTNQRLCAWSAARPDGLQLPSMEISSTCRGAAFGPADLVAGAATDGMEGAAPPADDEEAGRVMRAR